MHTIYILPLFGELITTPDLGVCICTPPSESCSRLQSCVIVFVCVCVCEREKYCVCVYMTGVCCNVLQRAAVCYNTQMQCVAVRCSVLH